MGRIILPEVSASTTPPSGKVSVYAKTDGQLYLKNDAGVESPVGGGGGGSGLPSGGSVGQLLSLDGSSNPFWIDRPPGIAKIIAAGRLLPLFVSPSVSVHVPAGAGERVTPFFVTTAPDNYGIMRIRGGIRVDVQNGANGNAVSLPVQLVVGLGMFPAAAGIFGSPSGYHIRGVTVPMLGTSTGKVSFDYDIRVVFTRSNVRFLYDYADLNSPPTQLNTVGDVTITDAVVTRSEGNPDSVVELIASEYLPIARQGISVGPQKIMLGLSQSAAGSGGTLLGDGGVAVEGITYEADWLPLPGGTPDPNNFGSFGSEIG